MATLPEIEAALVKADAAGNVEDAKALAAEIRRLRSGESTITGTAAEFGKGVVRGVSDIAMAMPKAAVSAVAGPIAGELASRGVEALAAPSRELVKAKPKGMPERIAGTAGEFTGALIAPGIPSVVQKGARLASKVVDNTVAPLARVTRNIIDPLLPGGTERAVGRTLLNLAGEKRAKIMSALSEADEIVKGSLPTAPEAAVKAGSAEFSAAQRLAEQRLPTAYQEIASSQEAARQAAIQSFGKTPHQLEKAIADRGAEAKKLYGEASKQVLFLDDTIKELFKRPSVKEAMKRAESIESEFGKAAATPQGTMSVGKLHFLKMAMDDLIATPERFGIGGAETKAISGTRAELLKWITSKSKEYAKARDAFAQASGPINAMQVGQQLEKSLISPLAAAEKPGTFATAMREAPRTLKKATGSPRFDKIEQVVGAEGAKSAEAVLADLARAAQYEKLSRAGASRAGEIIGEAVPALPATGPLHQKYMIFKTVFNRFGGKLGERELEVLAETLQTPKATLKLMKDAAARESLVESLRGAGGNVRSLTPSQRMPIGAGAIATEQEARSRR